MTADSRRSLEIALEYAGRQETRLRSNALSALSALGGPEALADFNYDSLAVGARQRLARATRRSTGQAAGTFTRKLLPVIACGVAPAVIFSFALFPWARGSSDLAGIGFAGGFGALWFATFIAIMARPIALYGDRAGGVVLELLAMLPVWLVGVGPLAAFLVSAIFSSLHSQYPLWTLELWLILTLAMLAPVVARLVSALLQGHRFAPPVVAGLGAAVAAFAWVVLVSAVADLATGDIDAESFGLVTLLAVAPCAACGAISAWVDSRVRPLAPRPRRVSPIIGWGLSAAGLAVAALALSPLVLGARDELGVASADFAAGDSREIPLRDNSRVRFSASHAQPVMFRVPTNLSLNVSLFQAADDGAPGPSGVSPAAPFLFSGWSLYGPAENVLLVEPGVYELEVGYPSNEQVAGIAKGLWRSFGSGATYDALNAAGNGSTLTLNPFGLDEAMLNAANAARQHFAGPRWRDAGTVDTQSPLSRAAVLVGANSNLSEGSRYVPLAPGSLFTYSYGTPYASLAVVPPMFEGSSVRIESIASVRALLGQVEFSPVAAPAIAAAPAFDPAAASYTDGVRVLAGSAVLACEDVRMALALAREVMAAPPASLCDDPRNDAALDPMLATRTSEGGFYLVVHDVIVSESGVNLPAGSIVGVRDENVGVTSTSWYVDPVLTPPGNPASIYAPQAALAWLGDEWRPDWARWSEERGLAVTLVTGVAPGDPPPGPPVFWMQTRRDSYGENAPGSILRQMPDGNYRMVYGRSSLIDRERASPELSALSPLGSKLDPAWRADGEALWNELSDADRDAGLYPFFCDFADGAGMCAER